MKKPYIIDDGPPSGMSEQNNTFPQVFSLRGKTALITGGGGGIGFHIAQCMAAAGAQVLITGRRETMLMEAVNALNGKAAYLVNDVTRLDQLEDMVSRAEARYGPISILVNNAGINMKKPALEVSNEDFDHILQTNLRAVFALTRACAGGMIARQSGSIIMISSMAAYYGIDRVVAYTASKAGVEGMVKALASEFSKFNVRVNAIAPGFIETGMMHTAMNNDPERMSKALARTPMGRFGRSQDVGWAAVFLASEAAGYVTGVSLPVDGGNAIGF
jgi:NAD(P)-dependent dehydrogenase (short-subunit alcohol dehydrogenase family)